VPVNLNGPRYRKVTRVTDIRCKFHRHFTQNFYSHRSQKHINSVKLLVSFCIFWDLCMIRCQFYHHLTSCFSDKSVLHIFLLVTVWPCNFFGERICFKSCSKNVGEIDTRCQFHQRQRYKYFVRTSFLRAAFFTYIHT